MRRLIFCALVGILFSLSGCSYVAPGGDNLSWWDGLTNREIIEATPIVVNSDNSKTVSRAGESEIRDFIIEWSLPVELQLNKINDFEVKYSFNSTFGDTDDCNITLTDNNFRISASGEYNHYELETSVEIPPATGPYVIYFQVRMKDNNEQWYETIVSYAIYPGGDCIRIRTAPDETEAAAINKLYKINGTVCTPEMAIPNNATMVFDDNDLDDASDTSIAVVGMDSDNLFQLAILTDMSKVIKKNIKYTRYSNTSFCRINAVEKAEGAIATLRYSFEDLPLQMLNTENPDSDGVRRFDYNDVVVYVDIMPCEEPGAATGLTASTKVDKVILKWNDPLNNNLDHVEVTWDPDGSAVQSIPAWTEIIEIPLHADGIAYTFTVQTVFSTGETFATTVSTTGEAEIATPEDLNNIRNDLSACYILITDIDMSGFHSGMSWEPIGTIYDQFIGKLNGNGHIINNLKINSSANYQALFGNIGSSCEITNLGLTGLIIKGHEYVGGLAAENYASVSNCYVIGDVSGDTNSQYVGGLIGNNYGMISNCYVSGTVSGSRHTGGLIGQNSSGTVIDCYTSCNVSGNTSSCGLGGLIGVVQSGSVNHCYATGAVSANNSSGGLVGVNFQSTINDCYATGNVSGSTNVYDLGGLVGNNFNGTVNGSYATGNVSGSEGAYNLGGLIGNNNTAVLTNSYAIGNVSGGLNSNRLGGLTGYDSISSVENCYAIGDISGTSDLGALVGYMYDSTISNCYFYKNPNNGIGEQLTEGQMKNSVNYSGWDFSTIWAQNIVINNGFPYLQSLVP